MKKVLTLVLVMVLGFTAFAQTKIQLRSADKAQCVKSDMTGLKASFSFSGIEAQDYQSERGTFSWITMPNTVIGGNEGDPQIPVINELIAVPFGATPSIEITSYTTTDYRLSDYGINTLVPRQPSLRKDQRPEEVPFVYNEAAYQSTRGFRSEPMAVVSVEGTMRGVRLGKMTIEPVSYDPVNNTLRVFNDINVEVRFNGADAKATENMLIKTYSPYFDIVYKQLFNERAVRDAYSDHPDLYITPVKMLVVTTSAYASSEPFQNWLNWKIQKGIDVDVQTVANGASSSTIQSLIYSKYDEYAPSFLVIVGDESVVAAYKTDWSCGSSSGDCVSDLEYASVDGDVYHDMFMSRMSVSSTTELGYLVEKILTYEQYTMSDPSYLSNVLLIAGADSNWAPKVGRPTIQYALNNYYNTEHGFNNVYSYITDTYTGCYDNLSSGVGFANYTAHGNIQEWSSPNFTNSGVNSLTNNDKYFWAVGNCCLTANWGNTNTYPCYGEAMIRAQNKGAFGYIGSIPESYWYEDYYFGVGAFPYVASTVQTISSTSKGMYDALFDDTGFNTLNSVPYIGNVAVTYAHAASYQSSVTDEYYWRAYQCLGDGSVMPYLVNPSANNVSHAATIGIGLNTFTVNADAGSYVAISKDNVLLGAAQVDESGMVSVPITPVTSGGDVLVVVTRQQRQPYMQTIPAVSLDGPYISLDSYTPNSAHVGDETNLSITFKNVGADATTGNTTVTLTAEDPTLVNVIEGTGSFGALAADATATVEGFSYKIAEGVADGTIVRLHYAAENGGEIYEGNIAITAGEAVLEYGGMAWNGGFTPGETLTLSATFKNNGHWQATNASIALASSSDYITINTNSVVAGTIEAGQVVTYDFSVTIAANCPETEVIPVTFTMTADGGLTTTGNENIKNACNVIFNLVDSYGDGWNGNTLTVSFSDGTPSETLTISNGNSANYTLEIGNGTHVTLTWTTGSYASECSFSVYYEGDLMIYQSSGTPSAGVLYQFDCNCAAANQTFNVTVSCNPEQGTVTGGGEFSFGESCTVTATPAEGYMFMGWTWNNEIVSTAAQYTFNVTSNMDLVASFAEGTLIGDGGTTTNNYLPSYNYYNYSLTQQIYTIEELGAPGMITSIAFYNGGAEKTRSYDFYMKSTSKSTFTSGTDWETVTEADKVFSGSVTMAANDWTFIVFDNPFIYDGASNVVLVADDNTGSYTSSPHMACRVFDAANQAIRVYDDSNNFDPTAPSSYNGSVLGVKNQLQITKESLGSCVRPTSLTATEVGPDFVTLTWTENGEAEAWVVSYNGTTVDATEIPFTLTGLDDLTEYTIMVSPDCDEDLFSAAITVTTLDGCPTPQGLAVSNVNPVAATLTWNGYSDSYEVQLGTPSFLISANFDNGIPADWDNTSDYAWTVVNGHIQSGNAGMSSSTSSISYTVTYPADGTIDFDAECMGEGTSSIWDKCIFSIDGVDQFTYGANNPGWNHYSYNVTAGEHTFTWTYSKDGSVNPTGDYLAVDNVEMKSGETNWNAPVAVNETEYTFTGLTPATTYCVRVQGFCGSDETNYSEILTFTTGDGQVFTKTIEAYTDNSGYYLIASPVGDVTATEVTNLVDGTYDLYLFDQTGDDEGKEWFNYKAGAFTALETGKGYLYANESTVTLTFTGTPVSNNGVVEVEVDYDANSDFAGLNLLGNPFAEEAYLVNANGMGLAYHRLNPETNLYVAVDDNAAIDMMEGVFYEAGENDDVVYFSTTAPTAKSNLNIVVSQGRGMVDNAIIRFGEGNTMKKIALFGNNTKVYVPQNGMEYAVVNATEFGEMPVNFKAEASGTYTMSFNSNNVEFSYLHLIDNLTGNDVDLVENPSYTFDANASDYSSRFKLVFATGDANNDSEFAFVSNGNIIVNGEGLLQVIDMTGRIVSSEQINGVSSIKLNAAAGVYVLQLNDKTQKIVVK